MELNPDSPVIQAMHDQWHKLLAIVMDKFELGEVVITPADVERLTYRFGGEMPAIALKESGETLSIVLMREADGMHLAEADRRERNEKAKVTLSGGPVDPDAKGAPQPIDPTTGMHKDYWILSDDERSKGFIRPVRKSYVHKKCGAVTTMNQKIAETYARDPKFYGATFCCACGSHFPVTEFTWDGTSEAVGS